MQGEISKVQVQMSGSGGNRSQEAEMSLAKVVHQLSTDNDFAAQWKSDPEGTLEKQGLKLSSEELAFLKTGLKRRDVDEVRLADYLYKAKNWQF
ncbi:MAG: hypothetical protein B6D39_03865 [Anaerolineae bacterium UTCFX2]|jgi:hypothetical protein|nr:MAG: hypothetical protein B6D39_03865 [Anaerolineae bacterium UTCFX2]